MSLLTLGSKLELIQKKSQNAISVFHKTISDLASIDSEIDKEDVVKQTALDSLDEARRKLQSDRAELAEVKSQNSKLANKIKEFLEV